jgi:hypothetical protein
MDSRKAVELVEAPVGEGYPSDDMTDQITDPFASRAACPHVLIDGRTIAALRQAVGER